jgi:hypothetical protein
MLVAAGALASLSASPARSGPTANWCSALAYRLENTPRHGVTVTVTCSAAVRELGISIPSARRLAGATAQTATRRHTCKIPAGTTAVCRIRLPADAGVAITAVAIPAPRIGGTVVFGATFAGGARTKLRLTVTGPPGDDG